MSQGISRLSVTTPGHVLVARESQGLLPREHLDAEILDPLLHDRGRLGIEDRGHDLSELFQQRDLDPPPLQADAGLDADASRRR